MNLQKTQKSSAAPSHTRNERREQPRDPQQQVDHRRNYDDVTHLREKLVPRTVETHDGIEIRQESDDESRRRASQIVQEAIKKAGQG